MSEYGKGYILKSALLDAVEWDNDLGKWVIWDDDLQSLMEEKNDVVEVVRRKDCKLYDANSPGSGCYYCRWFWESVEADDFCSYGERRP